MGLRWILLLLFFSGCKVSLRLIPFSAGAAFHSISICAAFSYILYIAALHCCVLYRAKPMTLQQNSLKAVSKTYDLRLQSMVISTYLCIDGIVKKCFISIIYHELFLFTHERR